ncbi:helix-turn-helix domain-containing protein [Thermodesulfobacteriota bacterium]
MSVKMIGEKLSVSQAAELCHVNRNTIGLWIRSGKLSADRVGRNYSIPKENLVFFLKSSGQNIPDELGADQISANFPTFKNCWDYFESDENHRECEKCVVFKNQMKTCFIGRDCSELRCEQECHSCPYYQRIYYPRLQFVEQIDSPAAVCKDFHFWKANKAWEDLCEALPNSMIGMGIENFYHPDSLGAVISNNKKREMNDPWAPRVDRVFLQTRSYKKLSVQIFVYPLFEPSGAWLLIANPLGQVEDLSSI